jgi:hypothetical protein
MSRSIPTFAVLLPLALAAVAAAPARPVPPPLLPPPQIIAPQANSYLDLGTALSWREVEGADSYHAEICGDPACARVLDRAEGLRRTYWQPTLQKPGSYFWRVTVSGGQTGQTSPFTIALTISGAVFDDPPALALRDRFAPIPGAVVHVYRDGAADHPVATLRTGLTGRYAFHTAEAGVYWVAVDSKSIGSTPVWAEQTYAPPGGVCTLIDGTTLERGPAGPCFGGRLIGKSDDASSLATSKHVARVALKDLVSDTDFAFSFNVVTSLDDYDSDDHPIQGSLRQFVTNANAVRGANEMRFVPRVKALESPAKTVVGIPPVWWTIQLRRPLPELRDAGTAIDGKAYSFVAPNSPLEPNRRRIGSEERATAKSFSDVEKWLNPELEIVASGDEGIVCTATCTVRNLALYGAASSIVLRADAAIERVIVGAHADATALGKSGTAGIQIEKGTASVREVYVADQRTGGILVTTAGARLAAERVEINRCGDPQSGAGIVLLSDGSTIHSSVLEQNFGAGIVLGLPTGKQPVARNVIDSCTISGNAFGIVISPGASDNFITSNVVLWNRFGGIIAAPFEAVSAPLRNRIDMNRFDENGGRPISLDPKQPDYQSMPESASCDKKPGQANAGVAPPRITSVRLEKDAAGKEIIVVQGEACPSVTVQLYQSYATTQIRDKSQEVPKIHATDEKQRDRETIVSRTHQDYPSIGEFNPIASARVGSDGHFGFTVPVVRPKMTKGVRGNEQDFEFRFGDFTVADPADTAFAALAIDAEGNTSELGMRHLVKGR